MLKKGILLKGNLLKVKFEEVGRVYDKGTLLKKIKSYPQNKLDRDLSRFLPKSQRKITSVFAPKARQTMGLAWRASVT